ncbi:MAG: phenylalanine--tRNA ligase subunit beta, partial [Clostridia bacterium]|nr:phenylalanine--tRNA ligase subunit beta [Clostridia bacterium]
TAEIFLGEDKMGYMGRLSYDVCEELAVEKPVYLVYLDYEALSPRLDDAIRYQPLSRFASETRDLALVAPEEMTCGELQDAILSGCKALTDVRLFDVYRSEALGEGKKSMAFQLTFSPTDHEFTPEEIDGYVQKILKKLSFMYGVTLR